MGIGEYRLAPGTLLNDEIAISPIRLYPNYRCWQSRNKKLYYPWSLFKKFTPLLTKEHKDLKSKGE